MTGGDGGGESGDGGGDGGGVSGDGGGVGVGQRSLDSQFSDSASEVSASLWGGDW